MWKATFVADLLDRQKRVHLVPALAEPVVDVFTEDHHMVAVFVAARRQVADVGVVDLPGIIVEHRLHHRFDHRLAAEAGSGSPGQAADDPADDGADRAADGPEEPGSQGTARRDPA